MKPTESEIKDASTLWADDYDRTHDKAIADLSHYEGAQWAISQMQPEWVSVEDRLPGDETYAIIWRKGYSPEQTVARQVFNMTHARYCFVDNSFNVYQIGEVVTHWTPLLESPTK